MIENQIHCLVVVIAVFLPPQSNSIDQDFTNPGSSNINFDNFGLAELAKQLAEASELDETFNETVPIGSSLGNILLNGSGEASTTVSYGTVTNIQNNGLTVKIAETVPIVDELNPEQNTESKKDNVDLVKGGSQGVIINENDQSKLNVLADSTDAYRVLEKRETQDNNSAFIASEVPVSNVQPESFQPEQTSVQGANAQPPKLSVDDLDGSRKFRDVDDDAGAHAVEEKLQPEHNSLFMKNQPSLVTKPKSKCSTCEDRMQKVVPDGTSFIELGGEHEEDDTIRKFQGMILLIDSIIETAGNSARKELGLCRKSKLADAACLMTNDDDKMEKAVLQIVSCVKDAMKDQLTSKSCIPLPRELHSFLIWLMHGSEGGGMCPPTVQEGKSKPSYLFHEDNHRPHLGENIYGSPPPPSASLLNIISSNKGYPLQVGKPESSRMNPSEEQDHPEPNINMQPQYEVENNQNNNNLNNQYLNVQQNNDLSYQRKLPFASRNFYRPLRSLSDVNIMHSENDLQRNEQAITEIRDPMEKLMTYPQGGEPLCPSDTKYESQLRNIDEYSNPISLDENDSLENGKVGKTIIKRDLSRRKNVGKSRDDHTDNKIVPRKKKRRDGVVKFKQVSQELPFDVASSTEYSLDVQSLLEPSSGNEEINDYAKDRKEKRKERKRAKCINRKDTQTTDDVKKYNKISDSASSSVKDENVTNVDFKTEDNDQLKPSDKLDNNSKSNYDDSLAKYDSTDVDQETDKKAPDNKPKKKKRKNNKGNSNKEKYSIKMSTDIPIQTGTVNMNLSDLLPSVDLLTGQPNKKNSGLNRKESPPGKKSFQVSISSKKSKQNKLKPSIVFEDDLADSNMEIDEEEYLEPEYTLNDAEEYDQSYSEDENDPLDLYYDSTKISSTKHKCDGIDKKEVKKKYRETKLQNKKGQNILKKNHTVKKKKKLSNKKNEKNQSDKNQTSMTTKSDSSQSRGGTTEPSTSTNSEHVETTDKENVTPDTVKMIVPSTGLGDNKYSQDKPYEKKNLEHKESYIEFNKEPSKNNQYRLESLEPRPIHEDTGTKPDKDTKYDKTLEEKHSGDSDTGLEEKQSFKYDSKNEEKQNRKYKSESEEKISIKSDSLLGEKEVGKSESQSEMKQSTNFNNKENSKYDITAEEEQSSKSDATSEDKQSTKYCTDLEETEIIKSDHISKEKQSLTKNVDRDKSKKVDPQSFYTVSLSKGKLCSKDESKNKFSNRNNFRNGMQKNLELKKKLNKAVSKAKESKFTKYPRTKISIKKKSQGTHDLISDDIIISKVRNKKKKEEDEEIEEDMISNEKDQEDPEEESDKDFDEDESIVEIKPKYQMCVDEDRSFIDPEGLSDIDGTPNSDIMVENFLVSKPVRTIDKPPLSKEAFLKIINSPEIMGGNFSQDSLLNVTNILKGIHMIGEDIDINTVRTMTEPNIGKEAKQGNIEKTSVSTKINARLTESTMVKLSTSSTAAPAISDPTEINQPAYNTYKPNTSTHVSQLVSALTAKAGSHVIATALAKQPTTPSLVELDSEILNLPLDRISFENSLQTLF